jgi:hypothetical protein
MAVPPNFEERSKQIIEGEMVFTIRKWPEIGFDHQHAFHVE